MSTVPDSSTKKDCHIEMSDSDRVSMCKKMHRSLVEYSS